jgi:plasmid maintenance system killer protein
MGNSFTHKYVVHPFEDQVQTLPGEVKVQLANRLKQLAANPRYPALRTHEVEGAVGDLGNKVFEAYINKKYRMTWEYGPNQGEIILRNVDNHDECLNNP